MILEWVTAKENSGVEKVNFPKQTNKQRPIMQTFPDGSVKHWQSVTVASIELPGNPSSIRNACTKRIAIYKECIWAYTDENDLPGEVWKAVPGMSVEASSLGRIKTKSGFPSFGGISNNGYMDTRLGLVHRLVCMAFHPLIAGYTIVNHKDGNKRNNAESNLEWIDHSGNTMHAAATIQRTAQIGRLVRQLTRDGKFIAEHESIQIASVKTRISHVCIPSYN